MTEQNERAFQKQPHVFLAKKVPSKKPLRRYRDIGLGFKTPREAIEVHVSPCFRDIQLGDIVTVGECRKLTKTVKFNVLKVTKGISSKKAFKKF
ncbi:hypothetical protein O3M35_003023 [Rhynocoris fuscipes]|uniref:Small ribosomal subunit protein uS17 N-terminal domain-containing protein n=1 Tax=Rhynocoris fuscipes TaxID=488301 RepID=A0AAW1CIV6_9HEMI